MKLVFATNNSHKAAEIQAALPGGIEILTLKDAGIHTDIEEPHETLEENAQEKARFIHRLSGMDCFADDTGLEVYALHNEPGVRSARYGGEDRSFDRNMMKLLENMQFVDDRRARFRTVICLVINGEEFLFEGICEGVITRERRGGYGFGYDPVFIPEGSEKTFGEMEIEEKNRFSHRKRALEKLVLFLNKRN